MNIPRPPERIETQRLALRVPRLADAQTIFERYTQDTEVTRYVIWRPHTHIDQTHEMQREGLLRRYMLHPNMSDEPRDCYIYAIVK